MLSRLLIQSYNHHQCLQHPLSATTVLNTIIYTKLWCVLLLTSFTTPQLQQITSIGSTFITVTFSLGYQLPPYNFHDIRVVLGSSISLHNNKFSNGDGLFLFYNPTFPVTPPMMSLSFYIRFNSSFISIFSLPIASTFFSSLLFIPFSFLLDFQATLSTWVFVTLLLKLLIPFFTQSRIVILTLSLVSPYRTFLLSNRLSISLLLVLSLPDFL